MIVEDERVARQALTWLLAFNGYAPQAFATAEDALESLAHDNVPTLALVDVDLPGMSGLDLAAQLEARHPELHVVLVTAAEGERIDLFRREHAVSYLRKPVDFRDILAVLARSSPPN